MTKRVIVAGAGPVGLTLAAELRLAGAEVLVLERLAEPTGQSRALGMHARTMEVLDQRGLLDRLEGRRGEWGHFGAIPLDFGVLDSHVAGQMMIPQAKTERALGAWAAELGVPIRRGHEVVGLAQDADGVQVEVEGPEGRYRLRAAYLVGCDGGRSTVRRLAGFDFPGTEATTEYLMADVEGIDLPFRFSDVRERGGISVIPLGDGVTRVLPVEFGAPPRRRTEPPAFQEVVERVARITGDDISGGRPRWVTSFGDATRQVSEYRRGRVLLAGDAAHIHLPAGGQGLNLGVQDAMNLGWKLGLVATGRAGEELLDTYHAERHPVGADVLFNTRAQAPLLNGGLDLEPLRAVLREIFRFDEVNRHLTNMISALDLRYEVGAGSHPLLGRRMPRRALSTSDGETDTFRLLHVARGVLLDLSDDAELGAVAEGWADRVDVVRASAPELPGVDAVLVRPDGYVAWAAPDAEGERLDVALGRWFGPPRTR
ncbi:bifunctional hydroxylase/dehydrase [Streptoalloteichus tenebrarius]|uniref:Bifunctional hydroxylase/dehydrase n=1 Tax=Streptoalloteichus tenebrarius (strain ATCC 17920 / DSM 40477 / JCM 4838 / CBS 697.72 / NBRC 16177 / NCIMB 11028 / NRRL B-12390 / A12253. 1 / ISP 5477) TaxID=1933 RepID=A0ABT1HYP1_STRSD|nr:FAD-dependent monooxygenase [Streptoalloteichus tenebrarius]MCP2260638.1 bifunctional hydroxylase/dehydrase [Streptoalloteichus tenebrarius]BFF01522.1 FAD-dependent monooxygenase [Streptoalloteichus tenebrarius]